MDGNNNGNKEFCDNAWVTMISILLGVAVALMFGAHGNRIQDALSTVVSWGKLSAACKTGTTCFIIATFLFTCFSFFLGSLHYGYKASESHLTEWMVDFTATAVTMLLLCVLASVCLDPAAFVFNLLCFYIWQLLWEAGKLVYLYAFAKTAADTPGKIGAIRTWLPIDLVVTAVIFAVCWCCHGDVPGKGLAFVLMLSQAAQLAVSVYMVCRQKPVADAIDPAA